MQNFESSNYQVHALRFSSALFTAAGHGCAFLFQAVAFRTLFYNSFCSAIADSSFFGLTISCGSLSGFPCREW
jgi:hypothetical protein